MTSERRPRIDARERPSEAPEATLARLRRLCAEVDFDLDRLEPSVLERLYLLAELTKTAADAGRMVASARRIFEHYDATKPAERWSPVERRTVVLGCVFSDIGKTGPRDADADGRRLIVEMFAVEGVRDETQSVESFLGERFPSDASDRLRRFRALGLDPTMSMRAFWNLHSPWTLEIVESGGVPREGVAAAATHHFLDDVNPRDVVAPDGRFTISFGENARFDRAEKLVTLLDKYDAVRRRGARTHANAITWLRRWADARPRARGDAEIATLIADLDVVLGTGD